MSKQAGAATRYAGHWLSTHIFVIIFELLNLHRSEVEKEVCLP